MKRIVKKILLWDRWSVKNKKGLKTLLIKTHIIKRPQTELSTEVKSKKTATSKYFELFKSFSIIRADISDYEVALYFAGGFGSIYQVEQWIKVLDILKKRKKFSIIVRDKKVFNWFEANTNFTIIYCLTIDDLISFYEKNNFKCILYVNNGFKNFQSLMISNALHVHINHGESDKGSTATNQAKAYDYVFLVAEAGLEKYKSNLIKIDNMDAFIKVGRPQLEHIKQIDPFDKNRVESKIEEIENMEEKEEVQIEEIEVDRKVILYAPTWEATHNSMNFTSLNDYGIKLIKKLLKNPNYFVVYKPHPNTGSRDTLTRKIDENIKSILDDHYRGEVANVRDINSLYPHVDLVIFDNSAVAIDYLYVDKPMLMTDMFYRMDTREGKSTIVKGAKLISIQDIDNITEIIDNELEYDTLKYNRNKVKEYFLGNFDYSKQESTKVFIDKIEEICDERDRLYNLLREYNENK